MPPHSGGGRRQSPGIGVLSSVLEILLFQPLAFFFIFRNIDAFDLEDDRPRAVVAACDHHTVVVGPDFLSYSPHRIILILFPMHDR